MKWPMEFLGIVTSFSLFSLMVSPPLKGEDFIKKGGHSNVTFLSGGVGSDEREVLAEMGKNYPVKLIFSNRKGEFLSNVMVRVLDKAGHPLLTTVSNGPWLFLDLPPGAYHVEATFREVRKILSPIEITEGERQVLSLIW